MAHDVEEETHRGGDTGEAFEIHRELVKLLVENIALSRNEGGIVKFDIIYEFGRPNAPLGGKRVLCTEPG